MTEADVPATRCSGEFMTTGLMAATTWRARLFDRMALVVSTRSNETRVVTRDLFRIAPTGKGLIGKRLKATIEWGGKARTGSLMPESYERWQAWREGRTVPVALAA